MGRRAPGIHYMMYLYLITNLINQKQYVGITKNPERRKREHFNINNKHGSKLVKAAIQKYGIENFRFEILYDGEKEWIKSLEIKIIGALETMVPHGYNLTAGGDGAHDYKHSEETLKRMSLVQTGKTLSFEHREKLSKAHTGKKCSPEACKKMSDAQKNRPPCSLETKQKLSKAQTGKKLSNKTREKISQTLHGRILPESVRKKISESLSYLKRKVLVDNIPYSCLKEASLATGVNHSTLRARFKRWAKHNSWPEGYKYL